MPSLSAPSRSPMVTRSRSRKTRTLFDRVFEAPPIYDTLFDYCVGTAAIACLAAVRRIARDAFLDYSTRSLHKLYLRFVPDPWAFRSLQARTGFLVSGSLPVEFFLGVVFNGDLDLYPWPGKERELGNFIIEQGYHLKLESWGNYRSFSDIMDRVEQYGWKTAAASAPIGIMDAYRGCKNVAGMLFFEKEDRSSGHASQIHLVASDCSPLITILGFHSTVVLNFITMDRAISLFPAITCGERATCALRQDATPNSEVMTKYERRGFTERYTLPMDTAFATVDVAQKTQSMRRWVGDKFTWAVPLSTTDVELPEEPQVDLTLYGFTLSQPTGASLVEVESDTDSPTPLGNFNVQLQFDQVDAQSSDTVVTLIDKRKPYKVPYAVPTDFMHTLKDLGAMAEQLECSCRDWYFNLCDEIGRDGDLRKWKLAYERHHNGELASEQRLYHLQHCVLSPRGRYANRQTKRRKLLKQQHD